MNDGGYGSTRLGFEAKMFASSGMEDGPVPLNPTGQDFVEVGV